MPYLLFDVCVKPQSRRLTQNTAGCGSYPGFHIKRVVCVNNILNSLF